MKAYKIVFLVSIMILVFNLSACTIQSSKPNLPSDLTQKENLGETEAPIEATTSAKLKFESINSQEAKSLMEEYPDAIILDVRTQMEFDEGYIEGALLLPHTDIPTKANELLPDKDALILVYCRSGNRSILASRDLVEMGYTQIKEFGGIINWPYDIIKP